MKISAGFGFAIGISFTSMLFVVRKRLIRKQPECCSNSCCSGQTGSNQVCHNRHVSKAMAKLKELSEQPVIKPEITKKFPCLKAEPVNSKR